MAKQATLAVAVAFLGLVGVVASPVGTRAETLHQALSSAYATNPALEAERARLRALDEEVPRAKSGYRPNIFGNADVESRYTKSAPSIAADGSLYPSGYGVNLNQPIFRGFQTLNAVREAEATVRAGRENLRAVEQQTLADGVTSYVDVIRDGAIVRLRRNNVRVLSRELKATQDRFSVGEVTRTDVAQSESRRAGSISDLDSAKADLQRSRAVYERVVGHPPVGLVEPPPIDRLLPGSQEEAVQIAESENPSVTSAAFSERAAQHAKDRIFGELLPQVDLEASYERRFDPSQFFERVETTTVIGRLTVPFYQGGEVSARVRQAEQERQSRFQEIEDARVQSRSDVVSAWSRLVSEQARLVSDRKQVEANQTALTGVREEEKVGQRTILDVLNAEQEFLDAQVELVVTRRDLVVASYAVLFAIGRLTAADLSLSTVVYDPEEYYYLVKPKWWGVTVTREVGYAGYDGSIKD